MRSWIYILMILFIKKAEAQDTSILRIINFNSYFTQHIDSSNVYQFQINKDPAAYYWLLKKAPVGLTINKDNGILSFRAARNYFLSGKLKYDYPYKVNLEVQSLQNTEDKIDTFFTISFYNTEIIPSKVKATVSGTLTIEEGETVSFNVQCETGSFPIETILFSSSIPLAGYKQVNGCGDEFSWRPDFEFVKETDSGKVKILHLSFIGSTRSRIKDSTMVKIIVRDALNYPLAAESYQNLAKNIKTYILQLKFVFLQLDKKIKRVKTTRTVFDLTAASTALTGTILNTSSDPGSQKTGKILPSIGLALTPIKEATSPNKGVEQNQAALIRTSIKRLEYLLWDNQLAGNKDPEITRKTNRLRDELKQIQVQLIDVPLELESGTSEEVLNNYFNSPKVIKKYRLKSK